MPLRFIQAIVACVALIGWLVYQLAVKKKPFASLRGDALAILFFIAVWYGIYYLITH